MVSKTTSPTSSTDGKGPNAPTVLTKSKLGSLSRFLLVASIVVIAIAASVAQLDTTKGGLDLSTLLPRQLMEVIGSLKPPAQPAPPVFLDKYSTDLVDTEPRVLVPSPDQCTDAEFSPRVIPAPDSPFTPVSIVDAMASPIVGQDQVFFMLNGQNEGIYVTWNGHFECLAPAAELAAKWLGADVDEIVNGVRLYSQMGFPVRNLADLEKTRNLVHILLDFQIWQWPGIQKGYQYTLDNGVILTTVGLSPKVFDVEFFFTEEEANTILELGTPNLNRSKVDLANSDSGVSSSRTSHTAFLEDDAFTRDFRKRSAFVARLPSPSYAERLQLVRYAAGEFYRQHLDAFDSREIVPKGSQDHTMEDYETWANWAAETIDALGEDTRVPPEFRRGGALFPNASDIYRFPQAFLQLLYADMIAKNSFAADYEEAWAEWMHTNFEKNTSSMMPAVMKQDGKPHYFARAVRVWEQKLGLRELFYTFPKKRVNGVTHYLRWIRWAKERITFFGDEVPAIARRDGDYFPKYNNHFQDIMLTLLLKEYSESLVTFVSNEAWYKWMDENRGKTNVLFKAMQAFPMIPELAIRAWERHVGGGERLHYNFPKYVRHFNPQRYVTLFLYLNNQTKVGGETVFPFSLDRFSDETIERDGMNECSTGLAVPPRGLHASLFYVQTPEGEVDPMARHGGCPPHEGIKWGSNSFMWNADAEEGAEFWTTK